MNNDDIKEASESEKVACEICLKEIPLSESKSEEAVGYVSHFCGLDCYEQWRHQKPSDNN